MGSSSGSIDDIEGLQYDISSVKSRKKQGELHFSDQYLDVQVKATNRPSKPLPCPRCNSLDTKFCYFNNYNVNQPRYYCKGCHRHWTAGGTLRNVPVGAGCRKQKHTLAVQTKQAISDGDSAGQPTLNLPNMAPSPHGMLKTAFQRFVEAALPIDVSEIGDAKKVLPESKPVIWVNTAAQSSFSHNAFAPEDGYLSNGLLCDPSIGRDACFLDPKLPSKPEQLDQRHCDVPNSGGSMPVSNMGASTACISISACDSLASITPPSSVLPPSMGGRRSMVVMPLCLPALGTRASTTADETPYMSVGEKQRLDSSEGCLWVPKTLRSDDPVEAARSSIWATLGLVDRPNSLSLSGACTTSSGNRVKFPKQPSSVRVSHPNPAATTHFVGFHEAS